jgi:hypothetical protein
MKLWLTNREVYCCAVEVMEMLLRVALPSMNVATTTLGIKLQA